MQAEELVGDALALDVDELASALAEGGVEVAVEGGQLGVADAADDAGQRALALNKGFEVVLEAVELDALLVQEHLAGLPTDLGRAALVAGHEVVAGAGRGGVLFLMGLGLFLTDAFSINNEMVGDEPANFKDGVHELAVQQPKSA